MEWKERAVPGAVASGTAGRLANRTLDGLKTVQGADRADFRADERWRRRDQHDGSTVPPPTIQSVKSYASITANIPDLIRFVGALFLWWWNVYDETWNNLEGLCRR
jgi:hypothetical protein